MTSRTMVATCITLALTAPAVQAQGNFQAMCDQIDAAGRYDEFGALGCDVPEGDFEFAYQGLRDGISAISLKGYDAQCQILQRAGRTGEPCRIIANAMASGEWAELSHRAARRHAVLTGGSNVHLPITGAYPGGYPPWYVMYGGQRYGWNGRGFFNGAGDCLYRCGYDYRKDPYGLFDNAALVDAFGNAAGTGLGLFFQYKLKNKELDIARETMRQPAPQPQVVPASQPAPVPETRPASPVRAQAADSISLSNGMPHGLVVYEEGREPIYVYPGDSISVQSHAKLGFKAACTVAEPVPDSRGGLTVYCASK